MMKQTTNIVKSVGLGLLAGTAVAAVGSRAMNRKTKTAKQMKKTAGKAIHTVGTLLDDVERMMK